MASRSCVMCQGPLVTDDPRARYCSVTCRSRASRARKQQAAGALVAPRRRASAVELDAPVESLSITDVARVELEQLGAAVTVEGLAVLELCARIEARLDTGGQVAQMTRELRAALAALRSRSTHSVDAVDELRERRLRRAGA